MPTFLESPRFPEQISYGSVGGPAYSTTVMVVESGHELRSSDWSVSRAKYDVVHGLKSAADVTALIAFFRAVRGRAYGFRFKDWADYQFTVSDGMLAAGVGSGVPSYQITKRYTAGSFTEDRPIRKPVVGTVSVFRNGSPVTVGASAGQISIDTTTGLVTFVADATDNVNANVAKNVDANIQKAVTGITKANPGVVTATAHGFSTGDKIKLESVGGMTQVNNNYYTITVLTADTFDIGVDTTAYGTYTSGGTATKYGITQTNPVRVHCAAHGFSNGDKIKFASAAGMTQVNGNYYTVANAQTNYFELSSIDGTAFSTYTSGATATKHGITQTNPVRVHATAHGLTNGKIIYISGAAGMTQVNNKAFTVANATTDYFELSGTDGTAYGTYTGSGVVSLFPQPTDTLTASGEFDVPVRFDTDEMQMNQEEYNNATWSSIPLVEIRV